MGRVRVQVTLPDAGIEKLQNDARKQARLQREAWAAAQKVRIKNQRPLARESSACGGSRRRGRLGGRQILPECQPCTHS